MSDQKTRVWIDPNGLALAHLRKEETKKAEIPQNSKPSAATEKTATPMSDQEKSVSATQGFFRTPSKQEKSAPKHLRPR